MTPFFYNDTFIILNKLYIEGKFDTGLFKSEKIVYYSLYTLQHKCSFTCNDTNNQIAWNL